MMTNFLFWGTHSLFSRQVLAVLLNAGIFPTTILLPSPNNQTKPILPPPNITQLPTTPPTIAGMAWHNNIPIWEVCNLDHPDTQRFIAQWQPDVAVVACFPQKFPPELLTIPKRGFVNVHPSLLPAFRGPVPLFWQFRAGLTDIGVTLHQMDATLDTGDMWAQAPITVPLGCSGQEADKLCAEIGGGLLVDFLIGKMDTALLAFPTPQSSTTASYQTYPTHHDFILDPTWTAQHAYHFMRGTAEWHLPYHIQLNNHWHKLTHALQITNTPPPQPFPQTITIPFPNQYLIAQTA